MAPTNTTTNIMLLNKQILILETVLASCSHCLSLGSAAFQLQWAQIHHLDVCLGEVQCPTSQKYCFTEHHQKGRENIMEPGDLCNLPSFCSGTFWHKSILALFIEFYFILKVCFILSRFCFSWSCFVLFSYKWLDYESQMHLLDRHA